MGELGAAVMYFNALSAWSLEEFRPQSSEFEVFLVPAQGPYGLLDMATWKEIDRNI